MIGTHRLYLTIPYSLEDFGRDSRYISVAIPICNPGGKHCLVSIRQSIGTSTELLLYIDGKEIPTPCPL